MVWFYLDMKYIILSLAFFVISVPTLAVAASMAKNTLKVVFERAGLPRKIELSPQLKSKIEGIMLGVGLGKMGEELLQTGNLQEIIWQLWETGAEQQSEELTLLLRDTLENAEIVDMEGIGIGRTGAQLVKFANGLRGVFKTASTDYDEFIREVMVYHFDRIIGTHVFPLTTLRVIDGEEGSIQLYIENSMSEFDRRLKATGTHHDETDFTAVESPNVKTLRLLTLSSDQINLQNYLFPFAGRIVAIDGSRAFSGGEDAVKEVARHLRMNPDMYNLDPTFVSQLAGVSSTLTGYEFERYVNISSSKYRKEFRHIDFVRRSVDEYVVTAQTTDPQSPERLRVAMQHRDFDNARALLDNGLSGDIALENALASHDVRAAEWLLEQGYQHNPERMVIHLESAIENENWQFVDWVLLEKELEYTHELRNIEDYLYTAWERKNAMSIFKWWVGKEGHSNRNFGKILSKVLDNKNFKIAMFILANVNQYGDQYDHGLYMYCVANVLAAAMKEKKYKITKQLANDVKQNLGNKADFFQAGHYWHLKEKENYKDIIGWVFDNGFFKDSSFYDMVDVAIFLEEHGKNDQIAHVRFLLRKYFATNNPGEITERLLESDEYDIIAKYWFKKAGKRHEILAHIVKTENYRKFSSDLEEDYSGLYFEVRKALKFSLAKEDFVAVYSLFKDNERYLIDALKEAKSWKFMVWLLENKDVSSLMSEVVWGWNGWNGTFENDFKVINWVLENIDAEKTKKLAESLALDSNFSEFFKDLQNRIKQDLYYYLLSDKPARIPEKYKLVLNFLLMIKAIKGGAEVSISEFESMMLNEIKLETRRVSKDTLNPNSKYRALDIVIGGGDLQDAESLLKTKYMYGTALTIALTNKKYFTSVEWLVSLHRHRHRSGVLIDILKETKSWEFLGWLPVNGQVDGIMYAALRENDFELVNWILENIDTEKTKKLAETLKDDDENILASSLHSLRERVELDLRTIFITVSGEHNNIERILERYRSLLSFLFENTNSMGESIDKFAEMILLEVTTSE